MNKFNNKKIDKVYLIAEIGSNHNQDKNLALEMIDMAAKSGADAVKFQSIRFDKLYHNEYETDKFKKWFKKIELNENWYLDLAKQAKNSGVDFISAPTYIEAVDLLEECDVPLYKVASPQMYGNLDIVRRVAKTGKPLIMSTGYCEYSDMHNAIKIAELEKNNQITLLHCISKYPMKAGEANLNFIQTLQKMTGYPVGFSDHSLDDHLTLAAVALGACVIEKHVTLSRNMSGPDHNFAMTFEEFGIMSARIRDVSEALGSGIRDKLDVSEQKLRKNVELKAFSKYDLKIGSSLNSENLAWSRFSGEGIPFSHLDLLKNSIIRDKKIKAGTPITWDMINVRQN